MQYIDGPSTAHNQNVKRKHAKQTTDSRVPPSSTIIHQTSPHRKCELLSSSSESDISSTQIQLRNKLNRNRNNVHSGYVRRKASRNCAVGTLLLVLICLVVNLESVIGALPLNYSSVNYYDNSSYATPLEDDSDIVPFLVGDGALLSVNRIDDYIFKPPASTRPSVIYQNEFAVFITEGVEVANQIATKHGFTNMGQVSKSSSFFWVLLCARLNLIPKTFSSRRVIVHVS